MDFSVPADHNIKLKESEKRDKYLNLAEKTMDYESNGDTNYKWCAWCSHQRIGTESGGLGNKMTSGDHPDYSIAEIGPNTEKSPWKLEETCCHSNFNEKPSAGAGVKKLSKE